ncbi:MAG TPA: hypothetical protein VGG39_08780 [Polyangiaceae bacterium]|jgi:prophage tail gpP-like protein
MPSSDFISDEIGNGQDSVTLTLGGEKVLYAQGWSVEESVLSQPARWAMSLGWQDGAVSLFGMARPGTRFVLSINGAPQMTGVTDSRELEMNGSGSVLRVTGRDALAPLHDGYVAATRSFGTEMTYFQLVQEALKAVGLDPSELVPNNANNRKLKAGVQIQQTDGPEQSDELTHLPIGATLGSFSVSIQARAQQTWLEFLRHLLDRAGLMLWAAADGSFVLATPNPRQTPTYELHRHIQSANLSSNILGWKLTDDVTSRHSSAIIYGRGGGRKSGRRKAKGEYVDLEVLNKPTDSPPGYGLSKPLVLRDEYVQTPLQAAYFAKRKLAEERRNGWRLEYTFAGHTLPIAGSSTDRAVVTSDTTIDIDDELLGIKGTFYIESVRRTRTPQTQTQIRLMRPNDLVFGDVSAPKTTGVVAPASTTTEGGATVVTYTPDPFAGAPAGAVGQNANGQYTGPDGDIIH